VPLNLIVMKTKLLLSALLSFIFSLLSSQVPQGFNYQAIARDGSGNPLTGITINVKLGIQADTSAAPYILWEEEHTGVKTNAFGLFTVTLGSGTKTAGDAPSFADVNWNINPLYVKTRIFYNGSYKYMGSSKLLSVPYSLVSGRFAGPVEKLTVAGTTPVMDDALFEVKNKDGRTVFAVYNEGVRVYVDDGVEGKGLKGGFAIGSFDKTKGTVQTYFLVRPDTIRMYIDDTPGKGLKGGFAIGGFDKTKGQGSEYFGVKPSTTTELISTSQSRILWYPQKEAFMAGRIIVPTADSVGTNSFATGFESRASGNWSQALGYRARAFGNYSTSIGKNSLAKSPSSFAFGDYASALGEGAYALGTGATAVAPKSFALGSTGYDSSNVKIGQTIALGEAAFAVGFGSVASSKGAFTFGVGDSASGPWSLAMGYGTRSRAVMSTTTGAGTIVEKAGWCASANGVWTRAGNWAAVAFGDQVYAKGHTSFATGFKTIAAGQLSSTFGDQTTANGYASIAMGYNTKARAYGSLVIGRFNDTTGTTNAWLSWDPVFVIGNGTSNTGRSNAMTVFKSGVADFGAYINLNSTSTGGAVYVNGKEALWSDGSSYSWGYDGTYNVFARKVSVGTTGSPGIYTLYVAGNAYSTGTWGTSDIRWKKNLQPIGNVIPDILLLNGYRFNWRKDEFPEMNFDNDEQIGLVAQDVEKIFPELVKTDDKGYKAVSYEKLSVLLLEGMKAQQKQIDAQNSRIENLEKLVQQLAKEK
jgi:hypothetical protein